MAPILKCTQTYQMIEYPKGMNLNGLKTKKRTGNVGVASRLFGKVWYKSNRGQVLFKNYDMKYEGIRVFNELLYDELAHQVGLSVAEYLPARHKGLPKIDNEAPKDTKTTYNGLASVNFLKPNEKLIDGNFVLDYKNWWGSESFTDYAEGLNIIEEYESLHIDKKEILFHLYKMMVLDSITFMEDRNPGNIGFIRNDKDFYFMEAPVIDNEFCFLGKNVWYHRRGIDTPFDDNQLLILHGSEMRMVSNNNVFAAAYGDKYRENVQGIMTLAKENKDYRNFLIKTFVTIDIEKALSNVEANGYKVTEEYKNFVRHLFELSNKIFKEEMKNILKIYETENE